MAEDTSTVALVRWWAELETADATETAGTGLKLLRELVSRPRLVARLDDHARSSIARVVPRRPWGRRPPPRSERPVGLALASMDPDGHVREWAVAAIAARPHPELAPFLVLRTGDWVAQVRVPARAALAALLAEAPERYLPAVLPMARQTADRRLTGFAAAQLEAAVLNAPDELRQAFARSPEPAERRLAFAAGLARGRLAYADLRALALGERDARIRSRAAGLAGREALWREDAATMRMLAAARSADVRAVGYLGLMRLGLMTETLAGLADDAALVRAIAREAARRAGIDALERYRSAVAGGDPAPGAIIGLAETGTGADVRAMTELLRHPSRPVRAASVQGLSRLEAVPVEAVLPLLHDPAPSVVREAATALRSSLPLLPAALSAELLRDPRPEVRRAGYRLVGREPSERLRAAVELALDPDPALAARGRADAIGMAHRPAGWWRKEDRTADDLITLIERARPVLGTATDELLLAVHRADRGR